MDITLQIIRIYAGTTSLNIQIGINKVALQFGKILSRAKRNVPEITAKFEALGFTRSDTGFTLLREAPSTEINNSVPVMLVELKDLLVEIYGVGNVIFSAPVVAEVIAEESVTVTEDITISLT